MSATVEYFGIRHHGPGSAKSLLKALDELQPSLVLIEGPSDASDLIELLGDETMQPPIALLAYDVKEPKYASFWPFAEYSPEYQAILWALRSNAGVRFIDLPAATHLAQRKSKDHDASQDPERAPSNSALTQDPLAQLAACSGYEDGESWWSDLVEETAQGTPVFSAIQEAIRTLREDQHNDDPQDLIREACMRVEIRKAQKETDGSIAVITGAWHTPALLEKHTAKDDQALLRGLPKTRVATTWAPWTEPRLAFASGYGAGVTFPGWYAHLWDHGGDKSSESIWLTQVARRLRKNGHQVSTASVIETVRLSVALASMRERPSVGFEELRDATVSCMCSGQETLWWTIAQELLMGNRVGQISDKTPLSPLIEDLQIQQKKAKLKPEALERELSLDLRSEIGMQRSTLLHRLRLLGAPWGNPTDAGRSRGTFREKWILRWEPEFAVTLIENLAHGPTIEMASSSKAISLMQQASKLPLLAEIMDQVLVAQLDTAVREGMKLLEALAARTSDCLQLLLTLRPLAEAQRYGEARQTNPDSLPELFERILYQATIAMPYATRDLDVEATNQMAQAIRQASHAIQLIESSQELIQHWRETLDEILDQSATAPFIAGLVAKLLFEDECMDPATATLQLRRRLSPGFPIADAAGYIEGFFSESVYNLIHHQPLREALNDWLMDLEEEAFVEYLPLLRRVFTGLDASERRHLLSTVQGKEKSQSSYRLADDLRVWDEHYQSIHKLFQERQKS